MKVRHLLAALAGVALVGCVTDKEYTPNPEDQKVKIAFDSPVMYDSNNATRAKYHGEIGSHTYGSTTYTYPQEEDFIIFGVEHAGDFAGWDNATKAGFDGDAISRDGSMDGWVPTYEEGGVTKYYYWPSGKMSFAACSPADMEQEGTDWEATNVSYDSDGLEIKDFTIPSDPANHFDLMFSKRAINQTKANMLQSASTYSGIPIVFQHALSSIHFSLMNSSDEAVVLTGITISGIHNKGTFNENIDEDANDDNTIDYAGYVINDGTNNGNVDPEWTVTTSSTATYDAFKTATSQGVTFPASAQYITNLLADTSLGNSGTNHVLLVLPQNIPSEAKLTVNYTVNGSASTKEVLLSSAVDTNNNSINTWKMGTKYTYRLVYTQESAAQDRIYFSPSSDGWKEAAIGVIHLE